MENNKKNKNNFGLAFKLAWGGNPVNKSSMNLFKGYWLMPELMNGLLKLSKYYVKLIIALIGIIGCMATLKLGLSTTQVFGMMIAFLIVDVILITPLIYMAVLPKPIADYMKSAQELTPEEQQAFEKQDAGDALKEKLEFRYKSIPRDENSKKGFFNKKEK